MPLLPFIRFTHLSTDPPSLYWGDGEDKFWLLNSCNPSIAIFAIILLIVFVYGLILSQVVGLFLLLTQNVSVIEMALVSSTNLSSESICAILAIVSKLSRPAIVILLFIHLSIL